MAVDRLGRVSEFLWTRQPKTRIRLQQWTLSLVLYLACAGVIGTMSFLGAVAPGTVVVWLGFVLTGLGVFYTLIRSGFSERCADPALTESQIAFGVLTVVLGYWLDGEIRYIAPIPLMVILNFGAFSLSWRRMAKLTACSLTLLFATAALLHHQHPGRYSATVDIATLLMTLVMLPATSVLAVMLGSMRSRLRAQRAELTAALERIRELATRDELTGLTNRRRAQELMQIEIDGVDRIDLGFSVAMIDLDHFKRINDLYGHGGGDAVLQRFAQEAGLAMRAGDVLSRWGGEEFLIFMPGSTASNAVLVVDRLRLRIQALRVSAAHRDLTFTFSAGVAQHLSPESVVETIARADAALYRAKTEGRNRVRLGQTPGALPDASIPSPHHTQPSRLHPTHPAAPPPSR